MGPPPGVLICSPQTTGCACFDKMFLLVHAQNHSGAHFLLAWNVTASGWNFISSHIPPFYWAFPDIIGLACFKIAPSKAIAFDNLPNQKHFLFPFGVADTISFALTSSRCFSAARPTQNQY